MTKQVTFDVAVIGGGIMGVAAARSLAARGTRVILFERGTIGATLGSSKGQSRIIRLAYSDADYIPLCRAAYAAWRDLEEEAAETLLEITGGLDLAMGNVPSWRRTQVAMRERGVAYDMLDQAEIRRRFPQFDLPENALGLFQRDAGVLHADLCRDALVKRARHHGVVIAEQTEVLTIAPNAQGVDLKTTHGSYKASQLVIAAGAATGSLLQRLGLDLPLTLSREQVAFFRPKDAVLHGRGRMPIFILHLGGVLLSSGFPQLREAGMKLMIENKRAVSEDEEGLDHDLLAQLEAQVTRLLPGLEPKALRAETCHYTLTPDEDFIIDRHPRHRHIVIVSACSGHGFKFGALFGEAIADLVTHQRPRIALDRFRIDRPALSQSHAPRHGGNIRRKTS